MLQCGTMLRLKAKQIEGVGIICMFQQEVHAKHFCGPKDSQYSNFIRI